MSTVSYPLDKTGLSTANKVPREGHLLTEVNDATYRILIPDFAPFYLDNFEIIHVDGLGVEKVLVRDLDYVLTLPYLSASTVVGKMLYGGASINNRLIDGKLLISYQCLGGDDVALIGVVREKLHEMTINPRTTSWEIIANKPDVFPPSEHTHPFDDVAGSDDMVAAVHGLSAAVAAGPSPTNGVFKHLLNQDNPHETDKEQVGLGNVENLPMATDEEVRNHAPVEKYITLRQALILFESLKNTA